MFTCSFAPASKIMGMILQILASILWLAIEHPFWFVVFVIFIIGVIIGHFQEERE